MKSMAEAKTDIKQEILGRLNAIYSALDGTYVAGRRNIRNLDASLGVLEDLIQMVQRCEIAEIVEHKSGDKK